VGNRLTQAKGGVTQTYTYNSLDQLVKIDEGTTTVATYTYDARGNQTKEVVRHLSVTQNGATTHYDKETTYTYDLRNMLTDVSVKTPEAHETTGIVTFNIVGTQNTYNATGKRVERVENAETTKFYYTGDALLYSTDAGNVLQTENILDLGGTIIASKRFETPDEAQANEFANKYYIYNYDVRGSVTNIIGPDGNTVIGYDYDEFGNTQLSGNSAFLNDVTFTSSVADTSSSLQYMNARFYQPSTGRFISQDTYTGNPYDPWTQNLYNYCSANPVNFVDPTGHAAEDLRSMMDSQEWRENYMRGLANAYKKMMNSYKGRNDYLYKTAKEGYIRNSSAMLKFQHTVPREDFIDIGTYSAQWKEGIGGFDIKYSAEMSDEPFICGDAMLGISSVSMVSKDIYLYNTNATDYYSASGYEINTAFNNTNIVKGFTKYVRIGNTKLSVDVSDDFSLTIQGITMKSNSDDAEGSFGYVKINPKSISVAMGAAVTTYGVTEQEGFAIHVNPALVLVFVVAYYLNIDLSPALS